MRYRYVQMDGHGTIWAVCPRIPRAARSRDYLDCYAHSRSFCGRLFFSCCNAATPVSPILAAIICAILSRDPVGGATGRVAPRLQSSIECRLGALPTGWAASWSFSQSPRQCPPSSVLDQQDAELIYCTHRLGNNACTQLGRVRWTCDYIRAGANISRLGVDRR